ncbi:CdaR family transcriptional regulator [Pontibacillus salicampi]|uniref:CdaR family transcriptional regulator n=1 Tax=Pontibacillus salicampi TaxID=1449801 RepID=A0ABV6LQN8_9BACI
MIISNEVAQSIVEETQTIMKRNINFMNQDGRIIASMDRNRIGDYHEGAEQVLQQQQTVIISSKEQYKGAKPGVNLPVHLHEQVVGVIGITGEPQEVTQLGELVQRMTEILIKEAYLEDQIELENRAKETFINEWIANDFEDEKLFATRGMMFDINIHQPRVAVILELPALQEVFYENFTNATLDVREEVKLQRFRRDIERLIQQHFPEPNDHVLLPYGSSRYYILLSVNGRIDSKARKEKITYRMNKIQEGLFHTYHQPSVVGIGRLCLSPPSMKYSVEEAKRALRYAVDHSKPLFYFEDLGIESFLYDISPSVRADFLERILKPAELTKIPSILETLEVFYHNNGSITETADKLHVHKNTLQYRLKKVAAITGYDPRQLKDSTLLQIALSFYKAKEKDI